jgi:hypothetical protein
LEGWIAEVRESPERFAEAAQDLCETFVRVYGDGVERLIGEGDIHPRAGKNLSFVDLSIDSQVDAFSPWYQLEPETDIESAEEALGYVERLEAAAAFPVHTLLTTDVLAEGVNLQECGVVVHFDLPWNPTKLIQRNGRIDRRLNPTFENLERREALHDQLVEKARSTGKSVSEKDWVAPSFYPPEQVYHLTVLPIEPEVLQSGGNQALATRVRESLQEKLEAIRTLFGLSNWPIVLTHEDSQEVLTGELDFETPGFRRREDLFAALRQLEDGAAEANERFKSFDAQLSVHVRVPLEERRRIIDLFADPDDPEIEEAWGRVKAAGIVSWTGPRPESSVVYADHDWTKANREGRGAISGVLVVEDEEADGGVSYITWGVARETGAQDTIGRRILPVYIRPTDLESQIAESNFLELTRMSALSDWNMLEGAAPSAPSELAADLLKAIIDLAVDGERIAQDRERKNEVIPLDDLTVDLGTPITDILNESSLLNTVIDNQQQPVSRRPQFGDGSTRVKLSTDAGKEDRSDKPPAFNLWVSFAELN